MTPMNGEISPRSGQLPARREDVERRAPHLRRATSWCVTRGRAAWSCCEGRAARRAGGRTQPWSPADLGEEWSESRGKLASILVATEVVQRMRRERVLQQAPALPHVDDRHDRAAGVVLDRHRARVAAVAIDEVRERHEPLVAQLGVDDSCEVALLDPQLRRVRQLREEVRDNLVRGEQARLAAEAEVLLGDVPREQTAVVAIAVDR